MRRFISFLMPVLAVAFFAVDQAGAAEVPHYFPAGIQKISTPALQWEAYLRYINITDICKGTRGADQNSFSRSFNASVKEARVYDGKKVTFYFDAWYKNGDAFLYYDFCGQYDVTPAQMQVVIDDFTGQFENGINYLANYFAELEESAVKIKAETSGMSEGDIRKIIDTVVPGIPPAKPQITYRELWGLPSKLTRASFVPKEVHLGYIPALGVTWLNTGVFWVSPQARVLDELIGKPLVMIHENIHATNDLESFPLSEGINIELLTSIPEMLLPEDKIQLMFHGYVKDLRDLFYVYTGFDFERARKDIILFDHTSNLRIDPDKFTEYSLQLDQIKKVMSKFFREIALPAYYADRIGWNSLNEKLQDGSGVWRILFALNFNPTVLGGNAVTMQWLEAHKPEIMRIAIEAFKNSGEQEEDNGSGPMLTQTAVRQLERITGKSVDELRTLAEKHGVTRRDIQGKTYGELIELYLRLLEKENGTLNRKGVK